MKRIVMSGIREAIIITVCVAVVSVVVNLARKGGIPLIADAEAFRVQTDAEFMKVEDALRLFDEGRVIFIDARDSAVFKTAHIEGAMNISPTGEDFESLAWLEAGEVYIICYASEQSQRQAGTVADRLIQMGLEKVFVLNGAIEAWQEAGLPIATGGD